MSELIPTTQAERIQTALRDYLTTTFALADLDAKAALDAFLADGTDGIFRGPFVRTRLPFAPATGWEGALDVIPEGFIPHGHQAEAWRRLSSRVDRPKPTLVTTGTGSGKTEAFLMPLLDHVVRARQARQYGVKALILYPMNALANDQASRLAKLIASESAPGKTNPYAGIRAAIYTGEKGPERDTVTTAGLITHRYTIRNNPPDILLTNYKMLDHLLLRSEDRGIWAESAESLRYIVLDEFHTYDGAQGTDVAMLLRRLGLTLKSHWPDRGSADDNHTDVEWERPLGQITPVGTSATLGDGRDSSVMTTFATQVFGETFDDTCVVGESRLTVDEWFADARPPTGAEPVAITQTVAQEIVDRLDDVIDGAEITDVLLGELFTKGPKPSADASTLLQHLKALPLFRALVEHTRQAVHVDDLARAILPPDIQLGYASQLVTHVVSAASHLRALVGRAAANIDLHLWVRELTRIDRTASPAAHYLWSDDGERLSEDDAFPAIYCRHCGRSGWGVELGPSGNQLVGNPSSIRRSHLAKQGRFRALIHAPGEGLESTEARLEGLQWFDTAARALQATAPDSDDRELREGRILPVITHVGLDAESNSRKDVCPACQESDGIRFIGSAIATMLSVSLSSLFGTPQLDEREKKALIFTDSVQDAAHRAGFVAARSQVLTMRAVMRDAFADVVELDLEQLTDAILARAGDDLVRRHRILPAELASDDRLRPFWTEPNVQAVPRWIQQHVRRRLLFDVQLEFGLSSRIGRTLERTGSLSAMVDVGSPTRMTAIGKNVVARAAEQALGELSDDVLTAWVRGVAEHLRLRGAIMHEWLHGYLDDGRRWKIWGGRPRGQGMPAFPPGRSAPAFPRVGGAKARSEQLLDNVTEASGWYARWTSRILGVTHNHGAILAKALLEALDADGALETRTSPSGMKAYAIPSLRVLVRRVDDKDLHDRHLLVCTTCRSQWPGSTTTVDQLDGAPCLNTRCPGTLGRASLAVDGFYRRLYASEDMRRIVAREHTSLLPSDERLKFEQGFKAGGTDPEQPNVLVATPTLEMGIDIGDLSAVFLASLPRTVASYLQRIGRAGRATGNALTLAYITGRGETLPRLGDPLSMINGGVRPPAIFLSAVEILQRQYLAHLVDRAAVAQDTPHTARGAMESADDRSFLGSLIREAEAHHDEHLDRFLGAFGHQLRDASVEHLRAWATPSGSARTSGLAEQVIGASLRWRLRHEALAHRKDDIQKSLPELMQAANVQAAPDEALRALKMAESAMKLTKNQIAEMTGEYWISVMEEFGLLPNYTLLGDATTLDVSITWHNPETQQYEHEATDFQRPTARALTEFAPGNTFYARGWKIRIDAVDLGVKSEGVRPWVCCPTCGFVQDVEESGKTVTVSVCPRCGDHGIADIGQKLQALEFLRASADINREGHRINGDDENRTQTRFEIACLADIDPEHVTTEWYVDGYDFGAKYLDKLTLRWMNLGSATTLSTKLTIGSDDRSASLFRVCSECGHIDEKASSNSFDEHRPWCKYRKSADEHAQSIALARTLVTQGVVLPLPFDVTAGDVFAQPSLQAALLMGIRDEFGGSPDHIGVETVRDPRTDGTAVKALLLHDMVPGGTGYLADLVDPANLWHLLHRAYEVVRDCPCQTEERLACHRCLLPFAPPWDVANVSRATAERHLRAILNSGNRQADGVPVGMEWEITEQPTTKHDPESALEAQFRERFLEIAKSIGMQVTQTPSSTGYGNTIKLTHGQQSWRLAPQVLTLGTQMDFELTSEHPAIKIAIYLDGYKYHASPEHNCIADDAQKRATLRNAGYEVLSITWQDVAAPLDAVAPGPSWANLQAIDRLTAHFPTTPIIAAAALGGPMRIVSSLLRDQSVAQWQGFASGVPLAVQKHARLHLPGRADLAGAAAALLEDPGAFPADDRGNAMWWSEDQVGILVRFHGGAHKEQDVVAILDDRDKALGMPNFKQSWQQWLGISDALIFRSDLASTIITSMKETLQHSPAAPKAPRAASAVAAPTISELAATEPGAYAASGTTPLPHDWAAAVDEAFGGEELAAALASAGVRAPDLAGAEVGDDNVPVDFAWEGPRIAVLLTPHDDTTALLAAAGWRCFDTDAAAIAAALKEVN
ncbi:MAG: DEAD/DEAH box helicase [Propionibacteriaceae bacterium]|nr:DEAD/DEAH box helicase [Propionibacteriaceae bacterium]